jgi:hypothetical protein
MRIDNPTGSIASLTGSFTGSFYGDGLGLINIESASYAETASYAASASYAISSSHEIVTEVSSSYAETATSSSYALTASYALNGGSGGGGGSADYSPFTTGSSADKILPKEGSNCDVIGSNSTIAGGIQNEIGDSSSTISFIGGGCQNLIGSKQNTAGFIGGGTNNTLHCYTGTGGAIVGGTNNLLCLSAAGFIGGGSQNTIKLSDRSVIVGGSNNIIVPGTTAHYISIVGGYLNTGSCGFAGILGGCQNHVNNDHSFIIGSSLTSDKDCYTFMNNADVAGTVSASIFSGSFVGDGSGLTGISGGGVTFDYTDSATYENLILGESLTLGTYSNKNTALGYLAFANNDSSGEGTFIGYAAGRYNSAGEFSGGANTSVGYRALMGVSGQTTGCRNTAVGDDAAYIITTANNTTAIGTCALRQVSNGSGNTAVGYNSGFCTTGGVSNSFFGAGAGFGVVGDCNVYIGSYAGSDGLNEFTGDNNIVIGENADPSSLSVSNEITIGNTSINSLRIPGLQSGASDGDVLTYSSTSGDITLQTPSGGGGTIYNSTVRYVAYNSTQLVEILSTGTMYSGLSWSRSGATITITSTAHGLSNGDYVVVRNMGDTDYVYGVISSVTTDSFQITNAVSSGDTSGTAGAYIPAADATSVTDSAATIGSPTVGDIQIISIKVHFGAAKFGTTFDLTMPTSLTNGAGGNTSTATMNPPIVGVWDLSTGAFNASGLVSVWGGTGSAGSYNVFQVGGINQLVDGMVKFTF